MEIKIPIKCPGCKRTHDMSTRTMKKDMVIACACGASIRIGGDDPQEMQRGLDKLERALKRMGAKRVR